MVSAIGVRELEEHTRDVLQRVRDPGEIIDIADEGRVVARLIPVPRPVDLATRQAIMEHRRKIIEDIGNAWPEGVSAMDHAMDRRWWGDCRPGSFSP